MYRISNPFLRFAVILLCSITIPHTLIAHDGFGLSTRINLAHTWSNEFKTIFSEELRGEMDFSRIGWSQSMIDVSYQTSPVIKLGSKYALTVTYGEQHTVKHKVSLYAIRAYQFGVLNLDLRERPQASFSSESEMGLVLRNRIKLSLDLDSKYIPFIYAESFNDVKNGFRSDKIRLAAGSNIEVDTNDILRLYIRYHIFNSTEATNYTDHIGIILTHIF